MLMFSTLLDVSIEKNVQNFSIVHDNDDIMFRLKKLISIPRKHVRSGILGVSLET